MQCKDIPDGPILEYLLLHKGEWCCLDGPEGRTMSEAVPQWANWKLIRAKMGQLVKRGLVSGCACGCRGDFEITHKGEAFLAQQKTQQTKIV